MREIKRKKRKDMRWIKSARLYLVKEFALAIDVSKATVRRWFRPSLPSLGTGPNRLIEGEKAKTWLKQKQAQRKKKCGHKQMYCMKCKLPRSPRYRSVGMQPQGPKRFAASATCAVCGDKMNRIFLLHKYMNSLSQIGPRYRDQKVGENMWMSTRYSSGFEEGFEPAEKESRVSNCDTENKGSRVSKNGISVSHSCETLTSNRTNKPQTPLNDEKLTDEEKAKFWVDLVSIWSDCGTRYLSAKKRYFFEAGRLFSKASP